ncbi:MAG: restriction endonuclease subunit S [Sedimentisphaerales bacterium]|jgi:type I restriction enzyme S subunit
MLGINLSFKQTTGEKSICRIEDVCQLIKGGYPTLKTPPGEYPLVVTATFRRSANTYQIDGKAICVPLISSTGHGHAALHRIHYEEGKFAVANLLVALVVKDENICLPKYLYYLLDIKRDEYFVTLMKGSANVSLKLKDIANVMIPLPTISEQRRIVKKIDELASKIDLLKKLQAETEKELNALLPSILDKAFKGEL